MTRRKKQDQHTRHTTERERMATSKYTRLKNEDDAAKRALRVYIYESEMRKINDWVLQYRNIETGGDLFGLWIDSYTAVVQFALGPGEKCDRYETAFYQDLEYLENAGSHLIKKHGLCNIGQWHSHHQLSLSKPSSGDESTVWRHMPTLGLTRYIVCIANISKRRHEYSATLNCFLFELGENGEELPVLKGDFLFLEKSSPMSKHLEIEDVIAQGAEDVNEQDVDDDGTSMSSWSQFKNAIRGGAQWVKSLPASKKCAIILVMLAVPLFAVTIVFVLTSKDHKPII